MDSSIVVDEITTQAASQIQPAIEVVEEADALKGAVVQRMVGAFKALAVAENTLSVGLLADAVMSIVPVLSLPTDNRPSYAKIGELILAAQGRSAYARKTFRLPDGEMDVRADKKNALKQYATPFVTLARWEAGMFTKAEKDHRQRMGAQFQSEIQYQGEKYSSPISAPRAGVPYSTAFREFRNLFSPSFTDLVGIPQSKTRAVAKKAVESLKGTVRKVNDDGDQVKVRTPVLGQHELTTGAIIALLEGLGEPLSESRYDEIEAALLKVQPVQNPA